MQRVLRVHVNRLCKNDAERKGHERLVLERNAAVELCMVRQMQEYLQGRPGISVQPLFPAESGERMSTNTPRHRSPILVEHEPDNLPLFVIDGF
jgi:hypothetical protein